MQSRPTGLAAARRRPLPLSLPPSLFVGETRRELREPIFMGGEADEMKLEAFSRYKSREPPLTFMWNHFQKPRFDGANVSLVTMANRK